MCQYIVIANIILPLYHLGMKLLEKIVSIIGTSNGRSLVVNIPSMFAREMNLKKGDKAKVMYEPKSDSIKITKFVK